MSKRYPVASPYVEAYEQVFLGTYVPSFDAFYAHPAFRKKGRLQVWAVRVLVEVLSWYRPDYTEDGQAMQRFPGRRLVLNYDYLARKYRVSKRTLERAVKFLEERGFLDVEVQYVQDVFGRMVGKRTLVAPNYEGLRRVVEDLLKEIQEAGDAASPASSAPNGRSDNSDVSEAHRSDNFDASASFSASPKRQLCPTEATSLSSRSDNSDAPKRQVCRMLTKLQMTKLHEDKTPSHPPALKNKAAGGGDDINQASSQEVQAKNGPEAQAGPPEVQTGNGFVPSPKREKTPGEIMSRSGVATAHPAAPQTPDGFLATLGLPVRLRRELAAMLDRRERTWQDLLAELARCYADFQAGRLQRPAVAAAVSLLRGNLAPPEFYDPEVQRRHLPDRIWEAAPAEVCHEARKKGLPAPSPEELRLIQALLQS